MSIDSPTKYEIETYEGRKICEKQDMASGYCGSCSLECHINQLNDPTSWVHSSKDRWYEEYHISCLKEFIKSIIVDGIEYVRKDGKE